MSDTDHGPTLAKLHDAIEELHQSLTSTTITLPEGADRSNVEFCLARGLQFVEGLQAQLKAFRGGDAPGICVFDTCPRPPRPPRP